MKGIHALVLLAILWSGSSVGTTTSTITTITSIHTYTQFGGGDARIGVATPAAGCDAYWLSASDPGYEATLSLLLSAYYTSNHVQLGGDDADLWSGSSRSSVCRIVYAALVP